MSRSKKITAEQADKVEIGQETILVWKATRPLSTAEHEQLSEKLQFESAQSGVKIVLVPLSVELEVNVQDKPEGSLEGREKPVEHVQDKAEGVPLAEGANASVSTEPIEGTAEGK